MQGWSSNLELHPKPPSVRLISPVTHLTLEAGHKGHPSLTLSEVNEVATPGLWFALDCIELGEGVGFSDKSPADQGKSPAWLVQQQVWPPVKQTCA